MTKMLAALLILASLTCLAEEKLLDLSFFQMDIRDVLVQISYEIGKPIVFDKNVTGFVTLEVGGVTVEKALDLILLPYGYQWIEMDGVYFVGTPDPKSPSSVELFKTYVYRTKGVDASKLVSLLPVFMRDYVMTSDADPTLVVINAPPKMAGKIAEVLNKVDIGREELVVEVRVVEVNEETMRKWGIGWQYTNVSSSEGFVVNVLDNVFDLIYRTLDYEILANIEISIGDGSAKLLANPKLRILNGIPGKVSTKTQRSYLVKEDNKTVVRTVEVGVEVELKPMILRNHEVLLDVKVTSSNILDTNRELPTTTTHSLTGTLRLKLGETVTVGGVGFDTYSTTVNKVPILGDIPVVGYLFKRETITKTHKEILILIRCVRAGEEG